MQVDQIIAALRAKTVKNGCTPEEARTATQKADSLEAGLKKPEAKPSVAAKPTLYQNPHWKTYDDLFGADGFALIKRSLNGVANLDLYHNTEIDHARVVHILSQNSFSQIKPRNVAGITR